MMKKRFSKPCSEMFSIPFYLDSSEVESLKIKTWKDNKYEKVRSLLPGKGYLTDSPVELKIEGVPLPSNMAYTIDLQKGWNMIGNPFDFPVDWNSAYCEWVDWSVLTRIANLATAQKNKWMEPWLWEFKDGSYKLTDRLLPWRGCFIKAAKSWGYYAHTLKIPPIPYSSKTSTTHDTRSIYKWWIDIVASAGGVEDEENRIGVAPEVKDGFDFLDIEKPPLPDTSFAFVYSFFPHPEWGHEAGDYAHDIREGSNRMIWSFIVKTNKVKGDCTLKWNLHKFPKGYEISLFDLDGGSEVYMQKRGEYSYITCPTRKFWICVSKKK
jgi:hypothetical protein